MVLLAGVSALSDSVSIAEKWLQINENGPEMAHLREFDDPE